MFDWLNKYEKTGIEGISTDGRDKSSIGRPKERFNSIEEELNYVKAECDFSKKVFRDPKQVGKKTDFKPFPN